MPLCIRTRVPSLTAIPADSWPRCWRAKRLKKATLLASSSGVYTPRTPHSSFGWSSSSASATDGVYRWFPPGVRPDLLVARLLQPGFGDRLEPASDHVERLALDHGRCHGELIDAARSLEAHGLQVRVLHPVLFGSLVLPALGVGVPDVFGVVRLLAANLTDPRHLPFPWPGCRARTLMLPDRACIGLRGGSWSHRGKARSAL